MRSRYTAHVLGYIDYLLDTWKTADKTDQVRASVEKWATSADWKGLKILKTEQGTGTDKVGIVEFIASYKLNGRFHKHHEVSQFVFENGQWLYVEALTSSD